MAHSDAAHRIACHQRRYQYKDEKGGGRQSLATSTQAGPGRGHRDVCGTPDAPDDRNSRPQHLVLQELQQQPCSCKAEMKADRGRGSGSFLVAGWPDSAERATGSGYSYIDSNAFWMADSRWPNSTLYCLASFAA